VRLVGGVRRRYLQGSARGKIDFANENMWGNRKQPE
jgi:hypothetical protein